MLMFIIHLLENMMTINFNEACVPNHLKIARAEKKDYQNASDIYVNDIVVMKVEKVCQLLNQSPNNGNLNRNPSPCNRLMDGE